MSSRKHKILIVDDDCDLVATLKKRLESEGFETFTALEGIRAVEIIRKMNPDLILLDWKMPAGTGPWVLQNLRSQMEIKMIPVLILSGADIPDLAKETKAYGAQAFMQKPFDSKALIAKIRTMLTQSHVAK